MAHIYRYTQPGMRLQLYTEVYDYSEQHVTGLSGKQPPFMRDFFLVHQGDSLAFAPDVTDIRGFTVNTPTGNTLGTVVGFLADGANGEIPYAYITLHDQRTVVVPTDQFTQFPDLRIVTLEGGMDALGNAPVAKMDAQDAEHADRYWSDYRRNQAA